MNTNENHAIFKFHILAHNISIKNSICTCEQVAKNHIEQAYPAKEKLEKENNSDA
jgi:hypothetical protein